MRIQRSFTDEDDATQIYVKSLENRGTVRSFEVGDVLNIPSMARASRPSRRGEPTCPVRRVPRSMLGIGFAAACVLIGIAIGTAIALGGSRPSADAAPTRVVMPAPVIMSVTPAPAPAPPKPASVAVRLDSEPSGATATLVEDGKATVLGATPLDAQLDPTRTYDVVFTLENHQTSAQHIDPAATQHVTVVLAAEAFGSVVHHRHAAAAATRRGEAGTEDVTK